MMEFSAQMSAVAATAEASADAAYSGGVAIFTLAICDLMYEASVGGRPPSSPRWSSQPKLSLITMKCVQVGRKIRTI